MFDRQSLVNVTLKIRAKFHGNWLIRFRDILHTVSKSLVSRKARLKFQNVILSHVSFTYFFYSYIAARSSYNSNLNPSPLMFDSPKVIFESHDLHFTILLKLVNSDANSITLYPWIYCYTPE